MGSYGEAKMWWERAIEAAPQFLPSTFDLFNAALDAGDRETAERMLGQVEARQGRSESWARMAEQLAGRGRKV